MWVCDDCCKKCTVYKRNKAKGDPDACGPKVNHWMNSYGPCEICGETHVCHDCGVASARFEDEDR